MGHTSGKQRLEHDRHLSEAGQEASGPGSLSQSASRLARPARLQPGEPASTCPSALLLHHRPTAQHVTLSTCFAHVLIINNDI